MGYRSPHFSRIEVAGLLGTSLLMAALFACSGGSSTGSFSRESIDPDGIRVVLNGAIPKEAGDPPLRLMVEQAARVGVEEGPDEQMISSPWLPFATGPDGQVGYVERRPAELRVYDRQGTLLFRAGRGGEGPGEWRIARKVWHDPGIGWLVFASPGRILIFDETGLLRESILVPELPGRMSFNRFGVFAPSTLWFFEDESMRWGTSMTYLLRTDWRTMTADTLYTGAYFEMRDVGQRGEMTQFPQSITVDGQGRAWMSNSLDYAIEVFGPSVGEHWRVRREYEHEADPQYGSEPGEDDWIGVVIQNKRIYQVPHRIRPAIRDMQWVGAGELWVFTSTYTDSTIVQVDVFNPDGVYTRSFLADEAWSRARFTPDGYAWRLAEDEDGVPRLTHYRYRFEP